jgi:hypothetical protein
MLSFKIIKIRKSLSVAKKVSRHALSRLRSSIWEIAKYPFMMGHTLITQTNTAQNHLTWETRRHKISTFRQVNSEQICKSNRLTKSM